VPAFSPQDPRTWYQKNVWRRRAKAHLRLHPLCVYCERRGIVTPAELVDHIRPHGGDWDTFRLSPVQSLCWKCHSQEKRRLELHGYHDDIDANGWPTDPAHPANR
jgi:5-methylcytosine-specific restriction enzyme A